MKCRAEPRHPNLLSSKPNLYKEEGRKYRAPCLTAKRPKSRLSAAAPNRAMAAHHSGEDASQFCRVTPQVLLGYRSIQWLLKGKWGRQGTKKDWKNPVAPLHGHTGSFTSSNRWEELVEGCLGSNRGPWSWFWQNSIDLISLTSHTARLEPFHVNAGALQTWNCWRSGDISRSKLLNVRPSKWPCGAHLSNRNDGHPKVARPWDAPRQHPRQRCCGMKIRWMRMHITSEQSSIIIFITISIQ